MQKILHYWPDKDKVSVGKAIKDLFELHRRPIKDDEILLFVLRLAEKNLPVNAVIAGLKNLEESEINPITLRVMVDAAHSMVSVDEPMGDDCPYCNKTGSISMWREAEGDGKNEVALACICVKGDDYVRRFAATKWTGALVQHKTGARGKVIKFTLRFPDILQQQEQIPEPEWVVA